MFRVSRGFYSFGVFCICVLTGTATLGQGDQPPQPRPPQQDAGAPSGPITEQQLGAPTLDAIGLLPPEATGIPRDIWGVSSAQQVVSLIDRLKVTGVPATRSLLHRLLLTETVAPIAATEQSQVLLSRIDKLIAIGAVDEADALIARAGRPDAALFERIFEIALLTGRVDRACGLKALDPKLSPGLAEDVFCAIRGRDPATATAKLVAGRNGGTISPLQEQHLRLLMDREDFPDGTVLDIPSPYTALDHVIREATGQPRPRTDLAPALLYSDLNRRMPLRDRIMSAERLTRLGDFPSSLLFNLYRARPPAASGGVWDRVAAIQTLDAALIEDDTDAVLAALADADTALSAVGLRSSLAEGYGAALSELSLSNAPSIRMAEILLLGGDAETAERWSVPSSPSERLRIALAIGKNVAPTAGTDQSIEILRATAASDAMNGQVATTAEHARMQTMITQDRRGEAILTALAILDAGEEIEPNDFAVALDILVKSDQRETAKRIALQTILSRP